MRLLLITGPPAVGKMTVGREIARRGGFRLFHNHHTVEPLIEVFGWGTPGFEVLNLEFRRRVIEESARAGFDLIFTFVWDMADSADLAYVTEVVQPYADAGALIAVAELAAPLEARLIRNHGASRLADKRSKRDLAWSDDNVRRLDAHQLNSDPHRPAPADAFLQSHPHLRLDTADLTAAQTAQHVLGWLGALAGVGEKDGVGTSGATGVDEPGGPG